METRQKISKEREILMKYVCQICGYVYDEALEKVPFKDLPATWRCPWCGAGKSDFKAMQEESEEKVLSKIQKEEDLERLSTGQMAALCSNLARGCEKQYKEEEAALFTQLASYFSAISPEVKDATVEKISEELQEDLKAYPSLRATADAAEDRGAARVCVWGEKATRMLSSLLNRYQEEGEKMFENQEIWVCSICGFVYLGNEPPNICPVCKVPAFKFMKIEGGKI